MANKELLIKTLKHEKFTGGPVPWVPFAGVHAGKLTGYTATEVLKDEEKLFKSVLEVNRIYKPQGQPVVFDLQLEAEILGCELVWADDSPPSVRSHPLEDEAIVPCDCKIPRETDGRLPIVLNVMRRLKAEVGQDTLLYGLLCGPFTLASHLRGTDLFMDMYDDEDYVHRLLAFCTRVAKRLADYYLEAGMDVIAPVDPMISQISADHFADFVQGPYTELFDHIRAKGAYSAFFVCGDATRNIEGMCNTGCDSLHVDENVDLLAAKRITDAYNVALGGNIPLTTVMLTGNQQDNMKYVLDLYDSIADKTNFILAPGCDMPYDTPVENTIAAYIAASEPDKVREMVANYTLSDHSVAVELPDYANLKKPLIEIFTLDWATCAACTYMKYAVDAVMKDFAGKVDYEVYKYITPEEVGRMKQLGVKNLPSTYINGKLKFSSITPSRKDLEEALEQAFNEIKA